MTVPWEIGARQKNTPMNKAQMYDNLLKFKEVMDRAKIPFVMIFGGLLGLMREGDLISWDNDVDFACFCQDHTKIHLVVEELKNQGFYIPDKNECPHNDHYFIKKYEKIEIWWFQKINNEWIYDNQIRYNAEFFNKLEQKDFLNTKWNVPSNPEEFLNVTYGTNWRIPNPHGSYIL